MPTAAIRKALGESDLFRDLSDQERDRIARFSREMIFETGDVLFSEGDPADNIIHCPSRNGSSGGGTSRPPEAPLRYYSYGAPGRVRRMVGGGWLGEVSCFGLCRGKDHGGCCRSTGRPASLR